MTDRLIRITTALAVVAVAVVSAIISYQHAYALVRSHGESGVTARLLPLTVDGLIWAAFMVVLDASRPNQPVPRLAAWSLGPGIVATVGGNLAHGVGHGPVGALVSACRAGADGQADVVDLVAGTARPPCRPSARPAMQLSRQVDDQVWAGPDAGKRALPSRYSPARSAGRPGTLSWNSAERSGSVTGNTAIARQRAETGRLVGPCRTSPSR